MVATMDGVDDPVERLVARREQLYAQLAGVGDFRRGSVSENWRRCGKATCACAQPGHRGHGPRMLWTRAGRGGRTVGRQLAPGEVDKVRAELEAFRRFRELTDAIAEVNEAICEARPVGPPGAKGVGRDSGAGSDGEKGGSRSGSGTRSRRRSAPNSTG